MSHEKLSMTGLLLSPVGQSQLPVWKAGGNRPAYDASAVKNAEPIGEIQESTSPVAALQPERGYSATNYDASVATSRKSLRCQIGPFYDARKVRNNQVWSINYETDSTHSFRISPTCAYSADSWLSSVSHSYILPLLIPRA